MNPYQNLPNPPETLTVGSTLARVVDSIGYRYSLATEGLTENEVNFRPVESSMNMLELLGHIYILMAWTCRSFGLDNKIDRSINDFEGYRNATLALCQSFKEKLEGMSEAEIEQVSVYLKRNDTTYSFWYLINGPMADALTHIGQINSWRRIAGNPCPRISPFTGEPY